MPQANAALRGRPDSEPWLPEPRSWDEGRGVQWVGAEGADVGGTGNRSKRPLRVVTGQAVASTHPTRALLGARKLRASPKPRAVPPEQDPRALGPKSPRACPRALCCPLHHREEAEPVPRRHCLLPPQKDRSPSFLQETPTLTKTKNRMPFLFKKVIIKTEVCHHLAFLLEDKGRTHSKTPAVLTSGGGRGGWFSLLCLASVTELQSGGLGFFLFSFFFSQHFPDEPCAQTPTKRALQAKHRFDFPRNSATLRAPQPSPQ